MTAVVHTNATKLALQAFVNDFDGDWDAIDEGDDDNSWKKPKTNQPSPPTTNSEKKDTKRNVISLTDYKSNGSVTALNKASTSPSSPALKNTLQLNGKDKSPLSGLVIDDDDEEDPLESPVDSGFEMDGLQKSASSINSNSLNKILASKFSSGNTSDNEGAFNFNEEDRRWDTDFDDEEDDVLSEIEDLPENEKQEGKLTRSCSRSTHYAFHYAQSPRSA